MPLRRRPPSILTPTCQFEIRVQQTGDLAAVSSRRFQVHVKGSVQPAPLASAPEAKPQGPVKSKPAGQPKTSFDPSKAGSRAKPPAAKPADARADARPTTPVFRDAPPAKKPSAKKRATKKQPPM